MPRNFFTTSHLKEVCVIVFVYDKTSVLQNKIIAYHCRFACLPMLFTRPLAGACVGWQQMSAQSQLFGQPEQSNTNIKKTRANIELKAIWPKFKQFWCQPWILWPPACQAPGGAAEASPKPGNNKQLSFPPPFPLFLFLCYVNLEELSGLLLHLCSQEFHQNRVTFLVPHCNKDSKAFILFLNQNTAQFATFLPFLL